MHKTITSLLALSILLSGAPLHAATPSATPVAVPLVAQVGQVQVQAATPTAGPNTAYLPIIFLPGNGTTCYQLTPLSPGAASTGLCVKLPDYAGTQSLDGFVTTVNSGTPQLFKSALPSFLANVPFGNVEVTGPPNLTPTSGKHVVINTMTLITETGTLATSVNAVNPMLGRALWVIKNALQDKTAGNPTLFPVSILAIHNSQPSDASAASTLFAECGQLIGTYVYGYPYDVIIQDSTANSANIWLAMKYPGCLEMHNYPYLRLMRFWNPLAAFPGYDQIEAQAGALVGPTTYHTTISVSDGGGVSSVPATVIVVTVGTIIFIAVFPEVAALGGSWYLLSGVVFQ